MVEAIVTFDYDATQDDELTLKEGQTITNITVMEEGWWEGELNGKRGLFPDNFVELINKDKPPPVKGKAPSPPPAEVNGDSQDVPKREGSEKTKKLRAKVVYSYHPQNEDEISLEVNDIIDVTGQPEDGWWEGMLKGKKGMFPSNFVTVIEGEDGAGTDKTDAAVAKEEAPPLPSEPPKPKQPKIKGVGFGNIFAGGEVKLRKTPANSSLDHSKKDPSKLGGQSELAQKRLSLKKPDAVPSPTSAVNTEAKPKEDSKKESKPEVKKEERRNSKPAEDEEFEEIVRERARVTFPYEAQHSDELELKEGDIVTVLDKEAGDSGWWFGEINGRKGVFPDNFVTMLPPEKEKVKKKGPAPMPERPASGPKVLPTETKLAPAKAMPTKPPPPPVDSPMTVPPRRPLADTVTANAHPKVESPAPKPHPIAAPKPVLPVPPKKPGIKPKAPPPKPSQPPEREEAAPPVVLRHQPSVEKKETTEGGFEDLKPDSGQKLTHITLSRPKNANRRPPSVFGGQGVNLSEARLKAQTHEENADTPDGPVAKPPAAVTSPTSPTNASQPPWVRELKARSIKRPSPLAKEPQPPVENGTVAPPPRPKSSPIGPTTAIGAPTPSQTAKGPAEISPSPSPATSRPTSLVSDMAGGASSAQVEELKKEVKSLQEQLSSMRSEFKKEVVNLMTELDEEKKHRMAMQVELDRIKKLVLEKQ
ncbi:SH3 domain-containing kinase-binding protein 1-like isoform X2 [Acanthaster planci]|uniref:SH3 domain-containing kinase-binding protein 1-like isoform X2 n=1 Tax=Acanthaster planci TaxID=133434 RepID=A0A8B7XP02_ACAPL|nr:SH3 domain-containing kinase-binding protein 1-like isoform X2 [Acanthaster planci]